VEVFFEVPTPGCDRISPAGVKGLNSSLVTPTSPDLCRGHKVPHESSAALGGLESQPERDVSLRPLARVTITNGTNGAKDQAQLLDNSGSTERHFYPVATLDFVFAHIQPPHQLQSVLSSSKKACKHGRL